MPALRRLTIAIAGLLSVVAGGTLAYVVLQGAPLLDALYMTIMAVFTVGFREVFPLDASGQAVTMAVIILGVASLAFATASIIEFLVEGHLGNILGRRRMDRQLERLEGHTIICGFGRVGRQVADAMTLEQRESVVVVVDPDPERLSLAAERKLCYVEGDASHEDVLRHAGLSRARGLVACTADDAENVLIALTAKGLQPGLFVVVRVKDQENEGKARRAGADRVIAPAVIGGRRIAALITRPYVVDFLDVVTHGTDIDVVLEEIVIGERSRLIGTSLRQGAVREAYGANVLAIRQASCDGFSTRPDIDHQLAAGDVLVVIGARDDLDRLQADCG